MGPHLHDAVDEDDDWDSDAADLGIDANSYDEYVSGVEEQNDETLSSYHGTLDEMFPDGVDEDNLFNREE